MLLTWIRRHRHKLELWTDTPGSQTLLDKQKDWRLFGRVLSSLKNITSSIDITSSIQTQTCCCLFFDRTKRGGVFFLDPLKTQCVPNFWTNHKIVETFHSKSENVVSIYVIVLPMDIAIPRYFGVQYRTVIAYSHNKVMFCIISCYT